MYQLLRDFDVCPDLCSKVSVFKMMSSKGDSVPTYLPVGLDAVLHKHAQKISSLQEMRRITGYKLTFFDFQDILVEVSQQAFEMD